MDHIKISVASVSLHRLSEDSISTTHQVSQALNLEESPIPCLDSHLTFNPSAAASNIHFQPLHLAIFISLPSSYSAQTWGKFPGKIKWGLCAGSSLGSTSSQVATRKAGLAEAERLRFYGNRGLCQSHGMLWDGFGSPQIKARRPGLCPPLLMDQSLAVAVPGQGSSPRGGLSSVLGQWSFQLEGCV